MNYLRWPQRAERLALMLAAAWLSLIGASALSAGQLPGNIWPNSALELDAASDGVPDFWHRGGSDPAIDVWNPTLSVSPTHSFQLNDTSTNAYGEWYSDRLNITGGTNYQLRYNLRYIVTNTGPMRVTVNFYRADGTYHSGLSYLFSGTHDFWEEMTQLFRVPADATKLGLSFTSGGGVDVTGNAWLDDISLAVMATPDSLLPYLEAFPRLPNPLVIRDWKQTARDYHQLAFNRNATGQHLPLLYEYTTITAAGYSGPAFGLPSYVGRSRDGGEGLTALGAVLGGTLSGFNMASLDGTDRVQQCEVFYSIINGHGLVLNNVNSQGSGSAWYDIFPSTLFYQVGARYPGRASFQAKMRAIADSWLAALPVLSNNWEHTGFDFQTMSPVDLAWDEPDMAIGIAWLEYMAYVHFQDPKYLTAADACMAQMDARTKNPFYETLACFGPLLASRMNAELGRNYSTGRHLNWIFSPGSDARPGWGCESGRWGNYDAFGLIGSSTDTSGYAFSMNTFIAAGLIAPVARYEPQYARLLGRWLQHVAANANLFYPDTLPTNMHSSAAWVQQTSVKTIPYEGVRHLGVTTPYATGDATEPIQDLNPYGAWGSGYMAALFQTSNVPGILQIDCLATETFPPLAFPTFLLYNPHAAAQQVTINIGSKTNHFYDTAAGAFLATSVTGSTTLTMQQDTAIVLVQCPAIGALSQSSQKLLLGGTVIDYSNGNKDTDGDDLPDWWESRYYGSITNALPQGAAVNGFNNLHCHWLGLDPTDLSSTFKAQATRQPGTGFPVITWDSVGGKTYAVEYASSLAFSNTGFTQALTWTESNVPAGVEGTATFLDDYTLTGGPPGLNGRYYRIRWVGP